MSQEKESAAEPLAAIFGYSNPASSTLGGRLGTRRGDPTPAPVEPAPAVSSQPADPGAVEQAADDKPRQVRKKETVNAAAASPVVDERPAQVRRSQEPATGTRTRADAPVQRQAATSTRPAAPATADEPDDDDAYLVDTGDASTDSTLQVSVYLKPATRAKVRQTLRHRKITNARLALEALTAMAGRLKTLLATSDDASQLANSAFPARTGRLAKPKAHGTDRKLLWTLQATPAEILVMDDWTQRYSAVSRSELIAVAIEAYLDEPDEG